MSQVRFGFSQTRDGIRSRHRALPQAGDLRKHEPHPVAGLATAQQLFESAPVRATRVLGTDESLEFKGIVYRSPRCNSECAACRTLAHRWRGVLLACSWIWRLGRRITWRRWRLWSMRRAHWRWTSTCEWSRPIG